MIFMLRPTTRPIHQCLFLPCSLSTMSLKRSVSDLQAGDLLLLEWATESGKEEEFQVKIKKIKVSESKTVFKLLFVDDSVASDDQVVRKTSLENKKWKLLSRASSNKRTSDENSNGEDEGLAKRQRVDSPSVSPSKDLVYNPILKKSYTLPNHRFVLAPMVGGSELAFRLLCRKYGTTLAYTPMMSSNKFANDEAYRSEQFQTTSADRPLVAHFSANDPAEIVKAAKFVESRCDAIDINLGCPQRVAHAGHFGSFLLDPVDRPLVMSIVKNLSANISIPCFVKIRLLDSVPDTIRLCEQLIESGAALIAIHARYRVNLVGRTGAGARDGPAHLDQVKEIKAHILKKHPHVPIIANGNVIYWSDVEENLKFTLADGIMSAEGILDDPALYAPSLEEYTKEVNKLDLALEYLDLVDKHPVPMKSVVFHIRRICRDELSAYQLTEEIISASSVANVRSALKRALEYRRNPSAFKYDQVKEKEMKDAIERRKQNESKRKDYEARMIRKAKREGKDLSYYLKIGSELPSVEELHRLQTLSKEESFAIWKEKYSQNCYSYHFEQAKCPRERACCFIHADASYSDTVAYG